jgi:hypothetical protein
LSQTSIIKWSLLINNETILVQLKLNLLKLGKPVPIQQLLRTIVCYPKQTKDLSDAKNS